MKRCACFILMTAVCVACGAYEFDVGEIVPFKPIIVTPTNAMVKFKGPGWMVLPDADAQLFGPAVRHSEEYVENDEVLILTPDKRSRFVERHGAFVINPVVFKDGFNGFRIMKVDNLRSFGAGERKSYWYFALSDTPKEVGEDDVEMIMGEKKEWQKFEKPPPAAAPEAKPADGGGVAHTPEKVVEPPSPPSHKAEEGRAKVSPPIREDNQGSTQSDTQAKPNRLWRYAFIPLCLIPVLYYFLRRKSNH